MAKGRADPLFDSYYWKKIAVALLINALTVPTIIILLFWFGIIDKPFSDIIKKFQSGYPLFFVPLKDFFSFFLENTFKVAIFEELYSRGPIRIATAVLFLLNIDKNRVLTSALWVGGLVLNYGWALTHVTHEYAWVPVFVAGASWLWLTIETKRLWPSIFCHATANLSIYFLIKIYQLIY
ncbi:MAG: hypothetical protein A2918_00705 [Candidatus Yanofskybacteria bacterium RIFCSPLOWO2_01_FULL_42_49]|uniref:CAAX prenyl protease 2/Lysostaphin resistance protein A-like domain-containing protein n=1 Tax=Candidatus Yanofskybacteria bacterium RIFCSPLOWO2_01_FULL_42_49 TaxID=1802694 RepID=A0A1F8GFT1_9BACT|nr:MAG: hypothetical protein A2918_00705 [Candidatus Yanofskybacteria bacterium RIFCSPLOWO2_01_FULL_42_49]